MKYAVRSTCIAHADTIEWGDKLLPGSSVVAQCLLHCVSVAGPEFDSRQRLVLLILFSSPWP